MAEVPASSQRRLCMKSIGYIYANGQRYRVGETHQRSTVSDDLVEQIRNHQDVGLGWRRIWRLLEAHGVHISRWTVKRICDCRIRGRRPEVMVEVLTDG